MEELLPKLDTEILKTKAQEAAMKGAIASIEEYYSSYSSPYRKSISEQLEKQKFGNFIQLPDIIALINESLTKEIDAIANLAVAKTFVPMVSKFLTREEKELNFSDILKEFIEIIESTDQDDYSVSVKENKHHGWITVDLTGKDKSYNFTMHMVDSHKKDIEKRKYQILSLPTTDSDYRQGHIKTMKLSIDGATLEMPFTTDILKDAFMSFIARLIIVNTHIELDCEEFMDHMFETEY